MALHEEVKAVQWACCWALFCMCVHNKEMQAEVYAYDALQATLRSMELHREDARVQEAGCWLVKELGGHMVRSKTLLSSSIQGLLKAMEKHPAEAKVQSASGSALRTLANHDTE